MALSIPAWAQFGASVAVDSDYRYRGVSLSDGKPTARLTLNYDGDERWYAGASATRATLVANESYPQLVGYAGWLAPFPGGRSGEIGVDAVHFGGIAGYDFAEAYVGLLSDRWSTRLYLSPDYYGRSVPVAYAELNAHVPLHERVQLFAHVGALAPLRGQAGDAGKARIDVSLGAGVVRAPVELHILGVAATEGGPYPAVRNGRRSTIVVGTSISF
ncbi:MAG TPA: TorF family putative porin [Caldimonas sp.]|nr:TorF family putative porin [Caldimonas sp.]HEX4235448.1 TorF family putative porin [Caldimonas sp.]